MRQAKPHLKMPKSRHHLRIWNYKAKPIKK